MSKIPFSDKHPIISSIIATFLFLMVITIGGVVSGITGVSTNITLIITFSILAIVLAIYTNSTNNWNHYGFNSVKKMDKSNKWLFMPLFIIALLPLIVGFSNDLKSEDIVYIVVFMAIVSFAEETMFRGVILRMLQKKSNIYAIWGSCLLFSIPHLLNTLSGKAPVDAIIQTLFALIIGLILAMLMIKTNNIIPLIMYHFTNNTVSSITRSDVNVSFEWYFTLFMLAISVVYALYLYQQIKNKRPKAETDGLSQLKI